MKKIIIYTISIVLLIIVTVGVTYAFFVATTSNNILTAGTHQLDVIYDGDDPISGNLNLVKTKEEGYNRTVSIALSPNSVGATANIYISVDQIAATLATQAFEWEIYQVSDNGENLIKKGTFEDCGNIGATKEKCTAGEKIYMITDYTLSTTPTEFKVYIWLNGYEAGNEVLGASFSGYIGAEAKSISGNLSLQ